MNFLKPHRDQYSRRLTSNACFNKVSGIQKNYCNIIEAAFSRNNSDLKFYKAPNGEDEVFYLQICKLTLVHRQKGTV